MNDSQMTNPSSDDAVAHIQFTPSQIADWKRYERVRKGGKYNMFMPQARAATGLSEIRYLFVMKNFSALQRAAEAK